MLIIEMYQHTILMPQSTGIWSPMTYSGTLCSYQIVGSWILKIGSKFISERADKLCFYYCCLFQNQTLASTEFDIDCRPQHKQHNKCTNGYLLASSTNEKESTLSANACVIEFWRRRWPTEVIHHTSGPKDSDRDEIIFLCLMKLAGASWASTYC